MNSFYSAYMHHLHHILNPTTILIPTLYHIFSSVFIKLHASSLLVSFQIETLKWNGWDERRCIVTKALAVFDFVGQVVVEEAEHTHRYWYRTHYCHWTPRLPMLPFGIFSSGSCMTGCRCQSLMKTQTRCSFQVSIHHLNHPSLNPLLMLALPTNNNITPTHMQILQKNHPLHKRDNQPTWMQIRHVFLKEIFFILNLKTKLLRNPKPGSS